MPKYTIAVNRKFSVTDKLAEGYTLGQKINNEKKK